MRPVERGILRLVEHAVRTLQMPFVDFAGCKCQLWQWKRSTVSERIVAGNSSLHFCRLRYFFFLSFFLFLFCCSLFNLEISFLLLSFIFVASPQRSAPKKNTDSKFCNHENPRLPGSRLDRQSNPVGAESLPFRLAKPCRRLANNHTCPHFVFRHCIPPYPQCPQSPNPLQSTQSTL
jgi:hypothetical protein